MTEQSLTEQVATDYLSFWMDNWQQLSQIWDPNGDISNSFSSIGWGLASMTQHLPTSFMRARHPGRALSLHMGITLTLWGSAQQSLWQIAQGDLALNLEGAEKLRQNINKVGYDVLQNELTHVIARQTQELGQGILLYLTNPFQRPEPVRDVVWERGQVCLYDYAPGQDGLPLLIIPSLVNRSYIMDMAEDRSFVRNLATHGFKPYVLDWGDPGEEEQHFNLTDYYTHRLQPALTHLKSISGHIPSLIGYCMGGLMALALAQRNPDISKAVMLATPWDFKKHKPIPESLIAHLRGPLSGELIVPSEVLQVLFYGLNPQGVYKKFQKLALLSEVESEEIVRLEDWVNDGVSLSKKIMDECLTGWFQENLPFKGEWAIDGKAVNPKAILAETLVIAGDHDTIVPKASSEALALQLPNSQCWTVPFTHTGLMTHRDAMGKLWGPMVKWLKK